MNIRIKFRWKYGLINPVHPDQMNKRSSNSAKKKLLRYYLKAAVYPLILSIFSAIVLSLTHDGSHYKSEWFVNDGFVDTVALTVGLSIIIAVSSTTIFLNSLSNIRENGFFSFLAWIIPSCLICLYFISHQYKNLTQPNYDGNRILDVYILMVPLVHLFCILFTYMGFQISLRNTRGKP